MEAALSKIKNEILNDKYENAFSLALNELRNAMSKNDQKSTDMFLGIIWSIYLALEVEYASDERKRISLEPIKGCVVCGSEDDSLFVGMGGGICLKCAEDACVELKVNIDR